MLNLVDVNESNWRIPLHVAKNQESYVSGQTAILARAYAYRNARSRAFYICEEETPIGMGMYFDCEELKSYDLSQFFVDARYQGKGYGKAAASLILDCMKKEGKYHKAILCYIEGNEAARRLYEGLGFVERDRDGDEIVMELSWQTA